MVSVVALASFLGMPFTRRRPVRAIFVVGISATAALWFARIAPAADTPARQVSWTCAGLALAWTLAACTFDNRRGRSPDSSRAALGLAPLMGLAALLFGVIATVIESVVLVMRVTFAGIDAFHGFPSVEGVHYGFSDKGLWSIGLLLGATLISSIIGRDQRLGGLTFALAFMGAAWMALLLPSFKVNTMGGYERTTATVRLMASWSVLMLVTNLVTHFIDKRRQWRLVSRRPDALADMRPAWPGLRLYLALAGMVVLGLVCYHLVVPVRAAGGGFRQVIWVCSWSAAVAAAAFGRELTRGWSAILAEFALGLISLTVCGLVVMLVPEGRPLMERYPMIFNAMMIGLALAAGLWTWLAGVWQQQLDEGQAWTVAGRSISAASRYAFLAAALAWVAGVVMMIWPRLSTVATADDSFGRVTAGVGANLFLLLVTLWSSRRLRRPALNVLTAMVVISTGGFLVVRMLPFRSYVG